MKNGPSGNKVRTKLAALAVIGILVAGATLAYALNKGQGPVVTSTCTISAPPPTSNTITYNLATMPANFTFGEYHFVMAYNGTGYSNSSDGRVTSYLGYSLIFDVTIANMTETIMFSAGPPAPSFSNPVNLPKPTITTAFGGSLQMRWAATCIAIFLRVSD